MTLDLIELELIIKLVSNILELYTKYNCGRNEVLITDFHRDKLSGTRVFVSFTRMYIWQYSNPCL